MNTKWRVMAGLLLSVVLTVVIALAGCGGNSPAASGGGGGGIPPVSITGTVTGPTAMIASAKPSFFATIAKMVMNEALALTGLVPVPNAIVTLLMIDNTGLPLVAQPTGLPKTVIANASGTYNVALPPGVTPSSNLIVFVSDIAGTVKMRAIVTNTSNININPVSELTVQTVANGTHNLATLSVTNVINIQTAIASATATTPAGGNIGAAVNNASTAITANPTVQTAVNNNAPLPPAAPAGVNATTMSSSQININWVLSASAAGYNIYRSNTANQPLNVMTKLNTTPVPAGPYGNNGLPANTQYFYKVTAVGANNAESLPSAEVTAITTSTPATPVPPVAPASVTATPVSSTTINISWGTVTGATGYNIYRATAPGVILTPANKIATAVAALTFNDTGAAAGQTYYYVVTAVNANGESAASMEVSAGIPPSIFVTAVTGAVVPLPVSSRAAAVGSATFTINVTGSAIVIDSETEVRTDMATGVVTTFPTVPLTASIIPPIGGNTPGILVMAYTYTNGLNPAGVPIVPPGTFISVQHIYTYHTVPGNMTGSFGAVHQVMYN